jgi:hypothetical protein
MSARFVKGRGTHARGCAISALGDGLSYDLGTSRTTGRNPRGSLSHEVVGT